MTLAMLIISLCINSSLQVEQYVKQKANIRKGASPFQPMEHQEELAKAMMNHFEQPMGMNMNGYNS